MKTVLITFALALGATAAPARGATNAPATLATATGQDEAEFDHRHELWTRVLEEHVGGDRMNYRALKQDRAGLDRYLAMLHAVRPAQLKAWTREQRYAFWINAYNAHVVQLIVDHYPLEGIKDIGSLFSPVWKKRYIPMPALHPGGKKRELSLNDIEHEILRPRFKDARVHAAVNCASVGCPPLRAEAFVADRLDEQLDDQVRKWLADSKRNRYEASKSTLRVSAIFDWFEEDFERDAGSVKAWISKYAPAAEVGWIRGAKKVRIKYLDYSWKLNEQR